MSNKPTIVDVRTPQEFNDGNISGSINIPLNEVVGRLDEFRSLQQPLVLCCASGGRSGQATEYLYQQGVACENGGGWLQLNHQLKTG